MTQDCTYNPSRHSLSSFPQLEPDLTFSRFPQESLDNFKFLLVRVDELEIVTVDEGRHEAEQLDHAVSERKAELISSVS